MSATLTVEYDGTDTLTAKYTFNATTATSQTFDTSTWTAFTHFDFSIIRISGSIDGDQQPPEIAANTLATFDSLNATGTGISLVPEPGIYGIILPYFSQSTPAISSYFQLT